MEYNYEKIFELKGKEPYTFANWKSVMLYIDAPATHDGNSKVKMQHSFGRYVEYHKEKHKIIVDRVKDKPDAVVNNRGSKYHELTIEIVKYLIKDKEEIEYSINTLAKKLGCINEYYKEANYHKKKTAKKLKIDIKTVNGFFANIHAKTKNIVVGTLDAMVKNELIEYDLVLKGKYASKEQELEIEYNEETDEEYVVDNSSISEEFVELNGTQSAEYDKIKQELFEQYGIKKESELFSKKKDFVSFYKDLNHKMFERTHLRYVHDEYRIRNKCKFTAMSDVDALFAMICVNDLMCTSFIDSETKKLKRKIQNIREIKNYMDCGLIIMPDDLLAEYIKWTKSIYTGTPQMVLIGEYVSKAKELEKNS